MSIAATPIVSAPARARRGPAPAWIRPWLVLVVIGLVLAAAIVWGADATPQGGHGRAKVQVSTTALNRAAMPAAR